MIRSFDSNNIVFNIVFAARECFFILIRTKPVTINNELKDVGAGSKIKIQLKLAIIK